MKIKELLDEMCYDCKHYPCPTLKNGDHCCTYNGLVEAMEKQTPKKPIRMYREVTSRLKAWKCPSCGDIWCDKHNYCYSCGQRLDWNLDWSKEDA